ncbi:MAG: DUF368 domain-containing protein [Erysipelotrichaceae bacterium]
MNEKIKYVLFGLLMGVANVIPGVSGGTMAIILNFYDRLMESITLNFKVIKKNLGFLIPLGIGVAIGIVGLSKIMGYLLSNYATQTYSGFIGVVLGSLPLIYHKAKGSKHRVSTVSWIPFLITFGIMVVLSMMGGTESSNEILFTTLSVKSFVVIFICMAIATVTMIIPGISGSLILIIMGMYETIYVQVIGNFDIPLLIPAGLGAVFGILGGAKLISFLLAKYQQFTYMAILGLLVGSLVELYMNSGLVFTFNATLISSLIAGVILFVVIYWFSKQEINRDIEGE